MRNIVLFFHPFSKVSTMNNKLSEIHPSVGKEPEFLVFIKDSVHKIEGPNLSVKAGKYLCFGTGNILHEFLSNGIHFDKKTQFFFENPNSQTEKQFPPNAVEAATNSVQTSTNDHPDVESATSNLSRVEEAKNNQSGLEAATDGRSTDLAATDGRSTDLAATNVLSTVETDTNGLSAMETASNGQSAMEVTTNHDVDVVVAGPSGLQKNKNAKSKRVHVSTDSDTETDTSLHLHDTDEDDIDMEKMFPPGTYMSETDIVNFLENPGTKALTKNYRGVRPTPAPTKTNLESNNTKKDAKNVKKTSKNTTEKTKKNKTKKLEFNVTDKLPKSKPKKQRN